MHVYPESKVLSLVLICRKLDSIINSEKFYDILENLPAFDFSFDQNDGVVDGREVAESFKSCRWDARVKFFKPFWPWSKVNGFYQPSKGLENVFVNRRRWYKRSGAAWAETILHEIVHLVDHWDNNHRRYGHGDNSPIGKSESAPWKISKIIIEQLYQ